MEKFYSMTEVAALLGITRQRLGQRVKAGHFGEIPRANNYYIFRESDVQTIRAAWMESLKPSGRPKDFDRRKRK